MKKKMIAAALALVMVVCFTACRKDAPAYAGTMTDLVAGLYEKVPVELSLSEPTAVDLTNADFLSYYTGLTDGAQISEAVFSEAMITAQAYSLCAIRVAEGADTKAVAQQVKDGINPAKWICVAADDVRVAYSGDVILLVMVDTGLSEALAGELVTAFGELVGAEPQMIA